MTKIVASVFRSN